MWEEWKDGQIVLRSARSGYKIGRVFPSRVSPGWTWAVEHVPSGRSLGGHAPTRKKAQDEVIATIIAEYGPGAEKVLGRQRTP